MQMTLTITAENPSEMANVLQALQTAGVTSPVRLVTDAPKANPIPESIKSPEVVETEPEPPAPRRGRPPKGDKLKVVPKDEPEAEKDPEPEPKKDITVLDVRAALTQFLAANDEAAAAVLLKKHGHTDRLSQLKPEYFEAVYHAAVTPIVKDAPAMFDDEIPDLGRA